MQFNSIYFALFFPIVFLLYWFAFNKDLKKQNIFLVVVSFFFFACFDWRFLFLLLFSILLDYFIAIKIFESISNKKKWLWLSIGVNICFLGFFKYFNFFIDNFSELISLFGFKANIWTLKIILPIGISFYTFHGLSYVIDVYNNKLKPVKSIVDYSLFVSFFPLLVAGPIERATHLLPQIQKKRVFDYSKAVDGLRQILWGLVKKVVIADGCAEYVNMIFENPTSHSGSDLVVGAFLFSFQIYGDFSGYTDIALGTARLLGIELLQNFSYPYFSRDIAEFWRRWHISLSSWFRDYIYIPLGGSRKSKIVSIRNIFIIFLLSGFWHGANWTFIFWGLLHALFFIPLFIQNKNRNNIAIISEVDFKSKSIELLKIVMTFSLVTFTWIFFRSSSLTESFSYIAHIFTKSLFTFPEVFPKTLIGFIFFFLLIEWQGRAEYFALKSFGLSWNKYLRISFYYLLVFMVLYYNGKDLNFIYFQF
ncbi:MAG: MBOAT family protein [Flavobacterium sp.]|uniref:MBOAT family O-acyltransferase n=1 Tax=Flavobacterium sp. TaxID=239 RepID=UPI0022CC9AF1|nr:MBOAT family O-acyltransferase [Flavobacterium sp.]MCZ8198622.1 MBOAT family protein [Flavobacterium sp.]